MKSFFKFLAVCLLLLVGCGDKVMDLYEIGHGRKVVQQAARYETLSAIVEEHPTRPTNQAKTRLAELGEGSEWSIVLR